MTPLHLVERPPQLLRLFFPQGIWRIRGGGRKVAYLTFDDGPVAGVTDQVLDLLRDNGVKATFFMVGDNARRHPELMERIKREGHSYGNHTMHHLSGLRSDHGAFLNDVAQADVLIQSPLFRPPHGWLKCSLRRALAKSMKLIMYDVVTRDYDRDITSEAVVDNVCRLTRDGSIIVFHDSEKSAVRTLSALPHAIGWLKSQGYELLPIPMHT